MIKCPNCSTYNNVQKFCGNCGNQLLADGVELEKSIDKDNTNVTKLEIRKSNWLSGTLLFIRKLITWIVLFCIGMKLLFAGSFNLMIMFTDFLQIRKAYFFIISLAILFFL
jgi:uncharacterized membrane protein YvbJ